MRFPLQSTKCKCKVPVEGGVLSGSQGQEVLGSQNGECELSSGGMRTPAVQVGLPGPPIPTHSWPDQARDHPSGTENTQDNHRDQADRFPTGSDPRQLLEGGSCPNSPQHQGEETCVASKPRSSGHWPQQSTPDKGLCSGWKDTSWHYQDSHFQAPAWTPSHPLWCICFITAWTARSPTTGVLPFGMFPW